MPFVVPELKLAAPQQNPQQAFSMCSNISPAGIGEPEELTYSQAEISKEYALYRLLLYNF